MPLTHIRTREHDRSASLSALADIALNSKALTVPSWRLGATYVQVHGEWCYLYRAVDLYGQAFDVMRSEHRDEAALRLMAGTI